MLALLAGPVSPSNAATFDATGDWLLSLNPGQIILGQEVPDVVLGATIFQTGETFSITTENLIVNGYDMGVYGGAGSIEGSLYTFNPIIEQAAQIDDYNWLKGSLPHFDLLSETDLEGSFDIALGDGSNWFPLGQVSFSGAMAAVPLPGAIWLLFPGILGILGIRKKL